MEIDRRKRTYFEEVADLYEENRTDYPAELIGDILTISKMPERGGILEVGCGPGNATISFARRGYVILAIELGRRLSNYAALNCQKYPQVKILNEAFEEWKLEEKSFDLVLSADAFHWIPPEIGYPRAARALKDSGWAAFFWTITVDPATDWSAKIDRLYEDSDPPFVNPARQFDAAWLTGVIKENFSSSGDFGEPLVQRYNWNVELTGRQYTNRLRTFSTHQGVNEAARQALYEKIQEVIEAAGSKVIQPQETILFMAKLSRAPSSG